MQARLAEGDEERSLLASQANSLAQRLREAEAGHHALRNEAHLAGDHRDVLEHTIRERNADLAAMRDELQQSLQVRSEKIAADGGLLECGSQVAACRVVSGPQPVRACRDKVQQGLQVQHQKVLRRERCWIGAVR